MFDRYFADQAPGWRRRALMGASLALHGLFAVAVVAWSWHQVSKPAQEIPLTFFAPPPPPPKAAAPATKKATPRTKVTRATRINPLIRHKVTQDRPPQMMEVRYDPDAVPGGETGGVKGGTVGGTGKMVPQFIADRQRLTAPDPHLPAWFTAQHPRETVTGTYLICISAEGRIVDIQVLSGIPGVDRTVIDQIRAGWTYKPQPLPFCSKSVIKFQIN